VSAALSSYLFLRTRPRWLRQIVLVLMILATPLAMAVMVIFGPFWCMVLWPGKWAEALGLKDAQDAITEKGHLGHHV
jgi:hypothetical protein